MHQRAIRDYAVGEAIERRFFDDGEVQSYISKGIWRRGIGSFVRNSCFNTMSSRHMPLLVHV